MRAHARRAPSARLIDCVFVYADGTTGYVKVEARLVQAGVYQRLVPRPFVAVADFDQEPRHITFPVETFRMLGRTFSGVPVFCAEAWQLTRYAVELPLLVVRHSPAEAEREAYGQIRRELGPRFIEVDRRAMKHRHKHTGQDWMRYEALVAGPA